MKTIAFLLSCIGLMFLVSCGPQSDTLPRDMANARVAQPSDLMKSPESFIVYYRVIEVVNENYMIVQSLGVNYEDEYDVGFSRCQAQGKTPVNASDTIGVLVSLDLWGLESNKDGYRRSYPPCEER